MKMRNFRMTSGAIGCCLALSALTAKSDTIYDYSLGIGNSAISGYTGPYGSVQVDLNTLGTIATITFTANSGFLFGDSGIAGVNVNATTFTVGNLSANLTSPTVGSGNEDGFGSFNVSIKNMDGEGDAVSSLSFTVTDTSGTWANAADVLTGNGSGYVAAAHIFVQNANGTVAVATGYAADNTPSVPDGGATIALLGFGLVGMDFLRRRLAKA